ncbi:MAG TPA: APC family permease [Planctomycetaceae bacterium]|jgi:APA family basic amino acid/polyamine antiporter
MSSPRPEKEQRLPAVFRRIQAFSIVIGSVVGSAIYLVPSEVAGYVPAIVPIAVVWASGALFSLAGALTLAELGAMLPRAGGYYVYVREAYGKLPGFLFGWADFFLINTCGMATLAVGLSRICVRMFPTPRESFETLAWESVIAVAAISLLTAANMRGAVIGGWIQTVGAVVKLSVLAAVVLLPWIIPQAPLLRPAPVWPSAWDSGLWQGMIGAIVPVLWAFDGWQLLGHSAEEIQDPGRVIPKSLIGGMGMIAVLYLIVSLTYHVALPMDEIAHSQAVGADFVRRLAGPVADKTFSVLLVVTTLVTINVNLLSGTRSCFAAARDGIVPFGLDRVHPRHQVPTRAILASAVLAIVLIIANSLFLLVCESGSGADTADPAAASGPGSKGLYELMIALVMFGTILSHLAAVSTIFILRRRRPELVRPFRTWGYPVTPAVFVACAAALLITMIYENWVHALLTAAILGVGFGYFRTHQPGSVASITSGRRGGVP